VEFIVPLKHDFRKRLLCFPSFLFHIQEMPFHDESDDSQGLQALRLPDLKAKSKEVRLSFVQLETDIVVLAQLGIANHSKLSKVQIINKILDFSSPRILTPTIAMNATASDGTASLLDLSYHQATPALIARKPYLESEHRIRTR